MEYPCGHCGGSGETNLAPCCLAQHESLDQIPLLLHNAQANALNSDTAPILRARCCACNGTGVILVAPPTL